jgi:hypothetical protein
LEVTVRLKVLISAYACGPYKGSELGVDWDFAAELAKLHDLWVIVEEEKCRADIEQYLAEHPDFRKRARFYSIHKHWKRWLRKIWPPSYYWYYRRWHQNALAVSQKLHSEVKFDLAHQLTMVGFVDRSRDWVEN